jgi:RNA methyltransferase, TrmH family
MVVNRAETTPAPSVGDMKAGLPPPGTSVDDADVLTKADLQRLRSLREKKHRETLGAFVVEGEKVVGELLAANFPLREIYATPDWPGLTGETGVRPAGSSSNPVPSITEVTAAEMARISHFPTPSTVLAVGEISSSELSPGALNQGLTLALDGVQDAGNVGTLLRIADWFAFDRVLLSNDCADLFHQKVINASMGSFARVKAHRSDLAEMLANIADGTPVLGCDLTGTSVYDLSPLSDAVVVIGSEGRGLSPAVAARLTQRVSIPRFGSAESLNAAVAAGIVCAQIRRSGGR